MSACETVTSFLVVFMLNVTCVLGGGEVVHCDYVMWSVSTFTE